jgi:hypothetical protein
VKVENVETSLDEIFTLFLDCNKPEEIILELFTKYLCRFFDTRTKRKRIGGKRI